MSMTRSEKEEIERLRARMRDEGLSIGAINEYFPSVPEIETVPDASGFSSEEDFAGLGIS